MVFRSLMDILYCIPVWQNKKYQNFISDANPDIVFLFAIGESFIYRNVRYLRKKTRAKIILSVEDDVYGAAVKKHSLLSWIEAKRLKIMFEDADKLYGASQMLCEKYSQLFNSTFSPIYKGCVFNSPRDEVNNPITIVYAGNLLYGRLETMALLSEAIRKINKYGIKIQLMVYSGTKINEEELSIINDGVSVIFGGLKPYDEIKSIMYRSDITLHVESFEPSMIDLVRYSFSTKIIDCLQSGIQHVIGPSHIASVEYARTIPDHM